nr:claudin-4-like [Pelodiscus sinensis]|eukprot:XP_025043968.1 claudin-4-like [Pelodiscus sinensis]
MADRGAKAKVSVAAGAGFILAGVGLLVPISWSAHTIVSNFYNPLVPEALKRELGASLYVGWASSALLAFGGATLCCSCAPGPEAPYPMKYRAVKPSSLGSYALQNYV